jgi:valyl-tRNA synthetase
MQKSQSGEQRNPQWQNPEHQKTERLKKRWKARIPIQELLNTYGSDTIIFTLAMQPGTAGALISAQQINAHRAFSNKIWNAARFVLMNLDGNEDLEGEGIKPGPMDNWFLHALNNLTDLESRLMEKQRVSDTAKNLYHFILDDFCRWYLEYSKTDIRNPECRKILKFTLGHLMQLLHPFLPYLTEEIYEKIKADHQLLLRSTLPAFTSELAFPKEYTDGEQLKLLINETRRLRTENRISPREKIMIILISPHKQKRRTLENHLKYYSFLTRSQETRIMDIYPDERKGFKGKIPGWDILIPFENLSRREDKLNKLNKTCLEISDDIKTIEAKLADPLTLARTPDARLSDLKKKLLMQYEKREKIKKTIGDLT